ncbi:hypothetical protein ACLB2K_001730 [Fragaria x ananassa]
MCAAIVASTFVAAMTPTSKLSLDHCNELVNLGDLRCPDKGFLAPCFFLIGKMNTAQPRRLKVSPADVTAVQFKYERLLGCCGDCAMINICGARCGGRGRDQGLPFSPLFYKEKCNIVIRPLPKKQITTLTPTRLIGVWRGQEEEVLSGEKLTKHSLALVPINMQPETLGFIPSLGYDVGQQSKNRGRPCGSRNKPKTFSKPARLIEVQQDQEEEVLSGEKLTKHSLAFVPIDMQPETLGIIPSLGSNVGQQSKKRGRPCGSRNKPKTCDGVNVLNSMVSSSMASEPETVVEAINP